MPPLTLLIISYNTREMTLACLRSVYEQTTADLFEVIVVDNASPDGSAGAIAEAFPQVKLIALPDNRGFAAANNLAATHATGEWLLLLNPDTVVLDRAVERLHAFALAQPEAKIFGGRTRFGDGLLNPASCWRQSTLWSVFCIASGLTSVFPRSGLFAPESFGAWDRGTVRQVDIVSGCFFLLPRALWEELGGFDPLFFMYGEEADLCLRAGKRGVRCMVTPDATIIHYGGASEAVRADKMVKLFTAKANLFRRHWSPFAATLGVRLLDLWALSRMMAFACLSRVQSRRKASFDTWRSIWSRRKEWHRAQAPPPGTPLRPATPLPDLTT
jgi:GT2 family glycosyltransferase